MKKISENIFKSYDVRGIYPDEINKDLAYKIGQAFVWLIKSKKVIVGHDCRLGGDELLAGLSQGITEGGSEVIDIGRCSTPMIYFAVNYLKGDGSIMITASHNPKKYNGFKMTRESAIPISGESGLSDIKELVIKDNFRPAKVKGRIIKKDITDDYVRFVSGFLADDLKMINIAVDNSNGVSGPYVEAVLKNTPIKLQKLFFEPDGNFPNHSPNPMEAGSLNKLQAKVKMGADFGAVIDADGDRIFFVDEKSELVPADLITALLAGEYKGKKVLYDLRSSNIVPETIKANSGQPIVTRIGHSFIKEKMRREKAALAGEVSGHYYYQEANYTDSAIITLMKMINLLSREDKKLSELIKPFKKYYQSGEINFKVKNKKGKMNKLKEKYVDGKLSELDGIRIDYDNWWFSVRSSNTEPLLRLNLEAKTEKLMKKKTKEVSKIIKQ